MVLWNSILSLESIFLCIYLKSQSIMTVRIFIVLTVLHSPVFVDMSSRNVTQCNNCQLFVHIMSNKQLQFAKFVVVTVTFFFLALWFHLLWLGYTPSITCFVGFCFSDWHNESWCLYILNVFHVKKRVIVSHWLTIKWVSGYIQILQGNNKHKHMCKSFWRKDTLCCVQANWDKWHCMWCTGKWINDTVCGIQ